MKNTKPSIRFAGFTDDWEERKLGDIYDFSKGKGLPLDSFTMSKISPAIAYGHLYTHYSEVISEVLLSSDDQGVMSKSNDLLFPGSSTVPNGTAQANAITLNNVKLGGDIIIGRPKKDSNVMSTFMSYQINSQREKLFPITVGSTISHMYGKDLANLTFLTTSLEEQGRISQLFYQLTNTIVLHQRQLDLLKKQKKGFLQKMFPKQGAKVPELRFAGFTDDWGERKLRNEAKITAGGDIDKSKVKEIGEYPIFANALTNDGIVGYYDDSYKVEAPAVTVTGRGDVGHAKARNVNFTPVVRLLAVKSDNDVYFLENAINNHKVLIESTGVPQLTAPQLGNYKIFFPNKAEQQKIGSFFKQLDDTIALHQRRLDLLKEQKKGLLQKMFVYY